MPRREGRELHYDRSTLVYIELHEDTVSLDATGRREIPSATALYSPAMRSESADGSPVSWSIARRAAGSSDVACSVLSRFLMAQLVEM